MRIDTLWCVSDPEPDSELVDILWEADARRLQDVIVGKSAMRGSRPGRPIEGLTLYLLEHEARDDAELRLRARREYDACLKRLRGDA